MMYVYQIIEKTENGNKRHGLFRSEASAKRSISQREVGRHSRILYRVARMTGWKRGKNAQEFQDLIVEAANSPYHVQKVSVDY
jgi:hypothetical protein